MARLLKTYEYAAANWDSVGDEWLALFYDSDHEAHANIDDFPVGSAPGNPLIRNGVLIFAVDDARALIKMRGVARNGVCDTHFRVLLRALGLVNQSIRAKYSRDAGIFAILADSDPRISYLEPIPAGVKRSRNWDLLPAFALTETMENKILIPGWSWCAWGDLFGQA